MNERNSNELSIFLVTSCAKLCKFVLEPIVKTRTVIVGFHWEKPIWTKMAFR